RDSLVLGRDGGDPQQIVLPLERLALLADAAGLAERAARLLGATEHLYDQLGMPRHPTDQRDRDRHLATIRASLGDHPFQTTPAAGRALHLDQAVSEALALADFLTSLDPIDNRSLPASIDN